MPRVRCLLGAIKWSLTSVGLECFLVEGHHEPVHTDRAGIGSVCGNQESLGVPFAED